jgi:uncharacterized protein (TIGR02302 family)
MIALGRLLLAWERAWPALWPASGVLGLYAAAALFGLLDPLSGALRSLLLLGALTAAGYALYRGFQRWKMPSWDDAARRVECDSRLLHRPITEGRDRLAAGAGDPMAELLWRAHAAQLLRGLGKLRLAPPSPGLAAKDPHALRYLVLLLVLGGFFTAGADWQRRLSLASSFDQAASVPVASIDAWITPPAYTGWAPLYLRPAGGEVAVPAGSELVMRVHGSGAAPRLALDPAPRGGVPDFGGANGAWGTSVKLAQDTRVIVRSAGHFLGRWRIRAIADQPPVIAFSAAPSRTERDALKIAFTAGDDYGVTGARAVIRPLSRNSRASLAVDLPLPEASAKTVTETIYRDLTAHPFAGLDVEMVLEASDGAGQIGRSQPVHVRLPERIFANPLARALVEQRQTLALGGHDARAAKALDALAFAPQRFYANQPSLYLGLRTAYWTLRVARSAEDIARVQDLLWQMANALEQGGLLDAAERLRELQQLLSQALARNAPQSEIDALLQRYREALQHYLQALAQNGPRSNGPLPANAKVLRPEDLEAMLKAIQQLAQTGARGKAAEMLSMLQNMLENLHAGSGPGDSGGAGQADKAMSDAIQGLGDMIGRQRQLLDKSLRQGQGAGDPKDGGGKGLSAQQGRLREDLGRIEKGLGQQKLPGGDRLGEAEREMGNAENALGAQAFDQAGQAQKNALEAMKEGAGQLAQELMKKSGQNNGNGQPNEDPLGRAEGAVGGAGSDTKLPNQTEMQRARAILEELRKRAAQPGRPKEELDYIDRLLRQF